MSPDHVWKPIPGFEDRYEASVLGQVRSLVTQRVLKPEVLRNGYERYTLRTADEKPVRVMAHSAVLLAFIGPRPSPRHEGAHEDGDKRNNRLSNLKWKTKKENADDKIRHGTKLAGETIGTSKLRSEDVATIRQLLLAGITRREIGNRFGVSESCIRSISKGRNWSHIPGHSQACSVPRPLTPERRRQSATKAAQARWGQKTEQEKGVA